MAKRHLEEYFKQVNADYCEFVNEIKELEGLCAEHTVSPEVLDNMKTMFEPLKHNWETLTYIMYLLNMPNKRKKENRYINSNKKKVINSKTDKDVFAENKNAIENIKNLNTSIANQEN